MSDSVKLIVGRNNYDNEAISSNAGNGIVMQTAEIPGPLGLLISKKEVDLKTIKLAGSLLLRYNNKAPDVAMIKYGLNFELNNEIEVAKMNQKDVEKYQI